MESNNPITHLMPFAERQPKPREKGLNYVRGPSILGALLDDVVACYAPHIDILKLSGHQASLSSEASVRKAIDACHAANIQVSVGNPPMDVAMSGGRACLDAVLKQLASWSVDLVEMSIIARSLDEDDLANAISIARGHGIDVIVEIGVAFAHSEAKDGELFLHRRRRLAAKAVETGARFILLESEGLTENRQGEPMRWDAIDMIVSDIDPAVMIFEADHQDTLSRLIDIYGPKANLFVDSSRIEILEVARRGFGPSVSLWGKVATIS